jgi:SAC3/GANP family
VFSTILIAYHLICRHYPYDVLLEYNSNSYEYLILLLLFSLCATRDPAVSHALQVRACIHLDNYHRFFQLYKHTPNLGNCILDMMIDARRLHALQRVCRAYKPSVPVDFIVQELAFESGEEGEDIMRKAGCVLEQMTGEGGEGADAAATSSTKSEGLSSKLSQLHINTKDSVIDMSVVFTQDKLLL